MIVGGAAHRCRQMNSDASRPGARNGGALKIPHLVRDRQFKPIISQAIAAEGCTSRIDIGLPKGGGYSGDIGVFIGPATEKSFEAEVSLNDWTRFPARIRAAATALRDERYKGCFRIAHSDGVLTIRAI